MKETFYPYCPLALRIAMLALLFSLSFAHARLEYKSGTITDIYAFWTKNPSDIAAGTTAIRLSDGSQCFITEEEQHMLSLILMAKSQRQRIDFVCETSISYTTPKGEAMRLHRIHMNQ